MVTGLAVGDAGYLWNGAPVALIGAAFPRSRQPNDAASWGKLIDNLSEWSTEHVRFRLVIDLWDLCWQESPAQEGSPHFWDIAKEVAAIAEEKVAMSVTPV